jgi:hypothetical protein
VHDTTNFEAEGRPAVFVASTEFTEAAHAQAEALGFDPAAVYVPHPIQDRSDAEMRALADAALEAIIAKLTAALTPR